MARIRRSCGQSAGTKRPLWLVGKYIRLSREDGGEISESVVNQDQILSDELPHFFEEGLYEVVDTYIDDGTSGTTDLERADFQRMVRDVRSGRINCIIVKNLSRAFRNSANQGRFLEEFIPLYNTRFISLYQPRIDTLLDPEAVHSLEVSITGFMNEQYAYKTSVDVRRTFQHKREKGEFIGAFAPYGYQKNPQNRNELLIDAEAAEVVERIFYWFVLEGMSKRAIAKRLNAQHILNPTAYKRSKGLRFKTPHTAHNDGLWNPTTIGRMLQDPIYIGVMRQGRQKVVSYKVHRRISIPSSEWVLVEGAVPPIIREEIFLSAQELCSREIRAAPRQSAVHLFSGLVFCAGCKKGMHRRSSKGYSYYACRTFTDKSHTACTKRSIREDLLAEAVLTTLQKQIALACPLPDLTEEISRIPARRTQPARIAQLLEQGQRSLSRAEDRLDDAYNDWKSGNISHEQYQRIRGRLEEQMQSIQKQLERLKSEQTASTSGAEAENPCLSAFLKSGSLQALSRGLLVELVRAIYVHEHGELEIVLDFADPFQHMVSEVETCPPAPPSPCMPSGFFPPNGCA